MMHIWDVLLSHPSKNIRFQEKDAFSHFQVSQHALLSQPFIIYTYFLHHTSITDHVKVYNRFVTHPNLPAVLMAE
jgi:hypothetical protein